MTPLPDSVSVLLRSSSTAAMAALLLISTSHRGLLDWFSRTVCGDAPAADPEPRAKSRSNGNGRLRRARRSSGHDKSNGADHRQGKRDRDDEALVATMRIDPSGTIGAWATEVGKSKTSIVSALARLRDAGRVVNEDRKWRIVEESAVKDPLPRWTKPLGAKDRAAQVHLTAS